MTLMVPPAIPDIVERIDEPAYDLYGLTSAEKAMQKTTLPAISSIPKSTAYAA